MAEKKISFTEFFRDVVQPALEPLSKVESKLKEAVSNIGDMNQKEMRKVFDDIQKRIKSARSEVEKAFNEGIQRTLAMLNLPSREELLSLERKVNKLAKDVQALKGKRAPAKKSVRKKAAGKKTTGKKARK